MKLGKVLEADISAKKQEIKELEAKKKLADAIGSCVGVTCQVDAVFHIPQRRANRLAKFRACTV